MNDNRCVCCGETIPEGRQICSRCEDIVKVTGDVYLADATMKDGTHWPHIGNMKDIIAWGQGLLESKQAKAFRMVSIL